MRILLTGCAGFIGSHLSENLLHSGHFLTGIDNFDDFYDEKIKRRNISSFEQNENFTLIEADIADQSTFQSLGSDFDLVIHLAARAGVRPSIEKPMEYINTNITGTFNILEWMRREKVNKLVFGSSSSVYGNDTPVPYNENSVAAQPISPYAFTKRACELMIFNYFHLYGISSVLLRFFTVYGPRQRPDLAIHKFFRAVYEGNEISIFGNGETYRDYTFVGDIVNGITLAANYLSGQKSLYQIVNLGNHEPMSLMNLIREIEGVTGKTANLKFTGMQPGDVDKTYADINKAQNLFGYKPDFHMREGLTEFNKWFLEQNPGFKG